jgi:type IV pilus assembly protein PilC
MDKFLYKVSKQGKFEAGEMEGRDEDEVAGKLREKGFEILSIRKREEEKRIISEKATQSILRRFRRIKKVDKVFMYKNFSTMLTAGLPLTEAIDLLRESIKNDRLVEVLGQLKYDVEGGSYISGSLEKYPDIFGTSEIAMIRAGEVGGTLPQSFDGLYQDVESERKLIGDIRGALMYPSIILSILLLVTLLLLLFVLPQLTGFFDQANMEIPLMTRIIMDFSAFLKSYFIYIAAFLIIVVVLLRVSIKRSKGAKKTFDKLILKIPMIGNYLKLFFIHKFARMLGLLLKSGVPILQALEIVEKSLTHIGYSESIEYVRKKVKMGDKLSDLISEFKDLYPPFVGRMLKVGDRTGNTAEALDNISEYYRNELEEALENIPSLIEPILMVFLGAGVALIAIAVLIPLYKIVSGINQLQK